MEVVGRPKTVPLWAHGFFAKSAAYNTSDSALAAVKSFKDVGFPLSGLVLPLSYKNEYFNKSTLAQAIQAVYNSSQLQLIYPLSYFVPNISDSLDWISRALTNKYVVKADGTSLNVSMMSDGFNSGLTYGWCLDVFNPKFQQEFLEPMLLKNMTDVKTGFWLEHNIPSIHNYMHEFHNPLVIPYRPGNAFKHFNHSSLPE